MTSRAISRALAGLLCAAAVTVEAQQTPPPAPAPSVTPAPAASAASTSAATAPAVAEPEAAAYVYTREGRRDPFVSLVGRAGDPKAGGSRPAGLAGILINELSLKGIMKQSGGYVALLQGPDKKTYVARPGQRLFDGAVKAINLDTVVFSQDVNDPLSLVKQREVRKTLRSSEEGQG